MEISFTNKSTESNKTGSWRTKRPVIDEKKCKGEKCGICHAFCPDVSIDIRDGKICINYDYCKGCGICAKECPSKAIAMINESEADSPSKKEAK